MSLKSSARKHSAPNAHRASPNNTSASGAAQPAGLGSTPKIATPKATLLICCFLLVMVAVVFGQTAGHDFINYDDNDYIYANKNVQIGFSGESIGWALTTHHAANWHPLTWLSHMLDCQLFELNAGGHHLTNVLLHAVAAILLFLALEQMTGALWPSAWVAAVFAIHPLRVESVAWAAERKDVLSGLFFMLTLFLYAHYARRPKSWGRYLLVLGSFALGLASKPMLVTLPFVLLLLDYWPLERIGSMAYTAGDGANVTAETQRTLRQLLVEKIPFFVLAALSCVVTLTAQRPAMTTFEQIEFPSRLVNATLAYVGYLEKLFCPSGFALLYPHPIQPPISKAILSLGLLAGITTMVVIARSKRPYLLVGWFWYLGTLVPVIGLVQVGAQAMADRYTYLPQIGICIAIAWEAVALAGARADRRRILAIVSAVVVVVLMVCSWQQTQHWRNSESIWARSLACTSLNAIAHHNLGYALLDRGEFDEAGAHFRKVLAINPNVAEAHFGLAGILSRRGDLDGAISHYRQTLRIKPNFVEAHIKLGDALGDLGHADEAYAHFRKAIELQPDAATAHCNFGRFLARQRQFDLAFEEYGKALAIQPDHHETRSNLGVALAQTGRTDEAIAQIRKALEIKPNSADDESNLGNVLVLRNQFEEAISHYQKALEINPDYTDARLNLASALTKRGQIDAARDQLLQALRTATRRNQPALVNAIQERLKRLQ